MAICFYNKLVDLHGNIRFKLCFKSSETINFSNLLSLYWKKMDVAAAGAARSL